MCPLGTKLVQSLRCQEKSRNKAFVVMITAYGNNAEFVKKYLEKGIKQVKETAKGTRIIKSAANITNKLI